jgi:hypothetical protein
LFFFFSTNHSIGWVNDFIAHTVYEFNVATVKVRNFVSIAILLVVVCGLHNLLSKYVVAFPQVPVKYRVSQKIDNAIHSFYACTFEFLGMFSYIADGLCKLLQIYFAANVHYSMFDDNWVMINYIVNIYSIAGNLRLPRNPSLIYAGACPRNLLKVSIW